MAAGAAPCGCGPADVPHGESLINRRPGCVSWCAAARSCALCRTETLLTGHSARSTYCTGDGFKFQISFAYSVMVRSLENFPEQATLTMAFLAQPSGSTYNASSSA